MLARYLRSHCTPVRYAMPAQADPELAASIRNYLALTLRGANVPYLHHQSQSVLQPFYQEHPAAQQAFHGLLGEHDPAALMQYLDLLAEHGDDHGAMPRLTPDVLIAAARAAQQGIGGYPPHFQLLGHLLNTARPLVGDLRSADSPVQAFSPGQMQGLAPILRQLGMNNPGPVLAAGSLYRSLQGSYGTRFRDARDTVRQGIDHLRHGRPEGLAPLYDTAHDVASSLGPHAQTAVAADAHHLRNQIAHLIHQTLIPHLYENQP